MKDFVEDFSLGVLALFLAFATAFIVYRIGVAVGLLLGESEPYIAFFLGLSCIVGSAAVIMMIREIGSKINEML